jgi:hypothetical protein
MKYGSGDANARGPVDDPPVTEDAPTTRLLNPRPPDDKDPVARVQRELELWASPRMQEVHDIIAQTANVDVTVLITGETGAEGTRSPSDSPPGYRRNGPQGELRRCRA